MSLFGFGNLEMSNARKVLAVGLSVVLFAAAAIIAPTASAAAISFNDFSSVAGLSINGNASQVGNELQLTPATFSQGGSAFSTTQVSFDQNASFSTQFDFRITNPGGAGGGADGLAFSLQTQGNNVGGSGGGLGYAGILDSLTIEFDTFNNGEFGGSNHVAIHRDGSVLAPLASTPFLQPNFDNGDVWRAWVDYNGVSDLLEVRWAQGANAQRPGAALLSLAGLDVPTILGQTSAFVGFTAATGAGFGDHRILSWQLNSSFNPIGVPAPAGLALILLGLAGLRRTAR